MEFLNLMSSLSITEFPLTNDDAVLKPTTVKINNVETEIVYGAYTDRIVLIVSQFEKIGSMYSVIKDSVSADGLPLAEPVYSVKNLFGVDNILQQTAARFLAEKLEVNLPFFLFICLKDDGPEVLKAIVEVVNQLKA